MVILLAILGPVAVSYDSGRPGHRMRPEAVNSLPALRAFETFWWDRTGGYLFSADTDDRVSWAKVTPSSCEGRVTTSSFQIALADPQWGWTPEGCRWEYFVLPDRCAADCSDGGAGDACGDQGTCFCAVAELVGHPLLAGDGWG